MVFFTHSSLLKQQLPRGLAIYLLGEMVPVGLSKLNPKLWGLVISLSYQCRYNILVEIHLDTLATPCKYGMHATTLLVGVSFTFDGASVLKNESEDYQCHHLTDIVSRGHTRGHTTQYSFSLPSLGREKINRPVRIPTLVTEFPHWSGGNV